MNATATLSSLTKRELEIAEMVAWGSSKKEIAGKLYISERTVENTVRSIFKKTGTSKSTELSALWFCSHYNIPICNTLLKKGIVVVFILIMMFVSFNFTAKTSYLVSNVEKIELQKPQQNG